MKITQHTILFDQGNHVEQSVFDALMVSISNAVSKVTWPVWNGTFNVNPTLNGNGVKPIKNLCMQHLALNNWKLEHRLRVSHAINPGPLDATMQLADGRFFAVEWETGNISSSHRALNKMALGVINGALAGGVLILPSRALYRFLTDRVGNYQELEPYFPVWRNLRIEHGYLAVIEIEHDYLDPMSPLIPKGTDGWAQYQ